MNRKKLGRPLCPQLEMEEELSDAGEDGAKGHYRHSAPLASWVLLEHYIKHRQENNNNTMSHVQCTVNSKWLR